MCNMGIFCSTETKGFTAVVNIYTNTTSSVDQNFQILGVTLKSIYHSRFYLPANHYHYQQLPLIIYLLTFIQRSFCTFSIQFNTPLFESTSLFDICTSIAFWNIIFHHHLTPCYRQFPSFNDFTFRTASTTIINKLSTAFIRQSNHRTYKQLLINLFCKVEIKQGERKEETSYCTIDTAVILTSTFSYYLVLSNPT